MMRRRQFVKKMAGALGVGLLPAWAAGYEVHLAARLAGNESAWTFVGSQDWSEDREGVLYTPVWTQCIAHKGGRDLLKREDFAYPAADMLSDTDLSIEFRTYAAYWSVDNLAIILRAQDSVRFYCVQIADLSSTPPQYQVRVFVQDASGYRTDIASARVPHPPIQGGPHPVLGSPEKWDAYSPGWMKMRAKAQGETLSVFFNDLQVLEVKDSTYSVGRAGIVARGPNKLRNLVLSGKRKKTHTPWTEIAEERPPYSFLFPDPGKEFGDNQTRPGIFRIADGSMAAWIGVHGDPHFPEDNLLVRSSDEGKTWGDPVLVKRLADGGKSGFFFGHRDDRISCLYTYDWKTTKRAFSSDGGRTWSDPEPLVLSSKDIEAYAGDGGIGAYSPVWRLSDGTLLQAYFHLQGKRAQDGSPSQHRSLVIRSTDDGATWTGPHYLDPDNYESNDCMVIEGADGNLTAFSRDLNDRFMWVNKSSDRGLTWTRQVPSKCPRVDHHYMLRHSSGVYLMASRGEGVFVNTSIDEGETWSRGTRISPCSGNTVMTELRDGKVLVVFQEAYRRPTRMRAHFMQVHKDGTLSPA